jgi:hypothetical protein
MLFGQTVYVSPLAALELPVLFTFRCLLYPPSRRSFLIFIVITGQQAEWRV